MRMAIAALLVLAATAGGAAETWPHRWVYVAKNLQRDEDVDEIRAIARVAKGRLTGMVLTGFNRASRGKPAWLQRVEEVKKIAAEAGLEIIPIVFSVGYGGGVLSFDRNLAEGLPVRGAEFVVRNGRARFRPQRPPALLADFERARGERIDGLKMQDGPGVRSFVDRAVFKEGQAAVRLENFASDPHGHGRIMLETAVEPRRCYRLSLWVKTEGLEAEEPFGVKVYADRRDLAPVDPRVPNTSDWRQVSIGFNSLDFDKVRVYAGVWGARGGKLWIDDIRLEEVALVNVLRREGTPLVVRDARGTVYEEGRDFAPIVDPKLNFRLDHEGPKIVLLPGSRIADRATLAVDYYHGMAINDGQVTVCMSEPKLYEHFEIEAAAIQRLLAPKTWLLSMDEIRAGGSCAACKARGIGLDKILGDCLSRQFQIVRRQNPKAEVFTWSDMLDPNHNARGGYYLAEGDFSGSWKHIPKEIGIVCWHLKVRDASLAHFSGLGFRTLAGAYYDADTLENPQLWLASLRKTPGSVGIMYTTWQNKYDLLGPFCELIAP